MKYPLRHEFALLANQEQTKLSRVFEQICDQIRTRLKDGTLLPGDKLPSERELAAQFGASRTAVREAFRSLEIAGLLELRPGVKGGAFIREGDPAIMTRSLRDMVHSGHISLESLTESRVIITDAVIKLACERATEADYQALERCIDRTEALSETGDPEKRRVQLVEFYRLLSVATGNEIMMMLVDALTDVVLGVLEELDAAPRHETVTMQRELIRCLRAKQPEQASKIMADHLRALHQHLFEAEARGSAMPIRRRTSSFDTAV
ncbi:MAG TPA: GntR family transcriptional regulator [Eoetvoesiella sp.]